MTLWALIRLFLFHSVKRQQRHAHAFWFHKKNNEIKDGLSVYP